jgi:hypothetical protein
VNAVIADQWFMNRRLWMISAGKLAVIIDGCTFAVYSFLFGIDHIPVFAVIGE